jgi:hypothetical protein
MPHTSETTDRAALAATNLAKKIDLTTLQLFVAICDEGNLTRASQREAIAPSAVSKRLHDLNRRLKLTFLIGSLTA